ncbi:MAG: phosphoribosylamine--glycine ligase [Cyanobacteria bacterium]|nr:phosphoribosylamine--glycine ligase [Cyanobacteria bacterium CG_2015-16_32_12]NCO76842.1 phosphoribosylamine--glycine ligase [Cyanobacteria bacterium CG_2015-22_32_23]NCQ04441.1 phosphoribosylamine--glycine ligase [Cyanobacteria bacterium CG_2015-09_32_10]NCQ40403.1 phosphoribosylamine--glycine ligase [Cyanobacteria bacterium CG_2015-04_32_10]NCS84491.1 phosphoribosylamine--glycine ligase [Cyanobacteria bacterium CG_2015-02_32_10]
MKVLVVGSGGREHALASQLLQSDTVEKVFCTPGNGGTARLKNCENVSLLVDDFEGILKLIKEKAIDLVVVGPELPLSLGITDYLQEYQINVFGPNKAGATIEASKSWAKDLMIAGGIPTAKSETFTDKESARNYILQEGVPIVVKADGLAAGKGVIVAMTQEEALEGIEELFAQNFGKVVIEEFLTGQEVSVLALTDGKIIRSLIPAQDHKQIGEGDTGANTGGMGAYAPTPLVNDELSDRITKEILEPTLKELQKRGIDYRGVLYAGLMITPEGDPKTLEFNCRFGDPETQAVLPMLKTPLAEVLLACAQQRLADLPPLEWHEGSAVCVVMVAGGYPSSYEKGKVITGIDQVQTEGVTVFHAGTKLLNQEIITDGGRVLGVTCRDADFQSAIKSAYEAVAKIKFEDMYYRRDIGHRIMNKL